MRYTSEAEVRDALGLPDWRHLWRDHVLQLFSMLTQMDAKVARDILGQLPDVAAFARVVIDDVANAYDTLFTSNSRSMEMVHEVQMETLALLKSELSKDLSVEEHLSLLNQVQEVHASALTKDTENKSFLSEQFDKRLTIALAGIAAVAIVVLAAAVAKPDQRTLRS